MDSEQDLTLIDAYLSGTLSAEEQAAVTRRLASDSAFRDQYEFTRSVQRVARHLERQRLKAMLQKLEAESTPTVVGEEGKMEIWVNPSPQPGNEQGQPETHRTRAWRWPFTSMGIAATVVAVLLVWQPTKSSNEELFAAYADTTTRTAMLAGPAGPSGGVGTRGEETVLPGFTDTEATLLARAVDELHAKDYEGAKALLKGLLQTKGEQPILLQNLAVAQLNSHEVAEAVRHLEDLRRRPDLAARDEVNYDLALGYIRQGKPSQARPLLQALSHSNSPLAAPAAGILSKLRWWF